MRNSTVYASLISIFCLILACISGDACLGQYRHDDGLLPGRDYGQRLEPADLRQTESSGVDIDIIDGRQISVATVGYPDCTLVRSPFLAKKQYLRASKRSDDGQEVRERPVRGDDGHG